MKIIIIITSFLLFHNCTFNKIVDHHGIHFLEKKQKNLVVNETNKNDIITLIGPPSTKSLFDNDLWIYIERKTTAKNLRAFGKKNILVNDVLILEINNKGLLVAKTLYNKDDMNKMKFSQNSTGFERSKESFVNTTLRILRDKINDPLGTKKTN